MVTKARLGFGIHCSVRLTCLFATLWRRPLGAVGRCPSFFLEGLATRGLRSIMGAIPALGPNSRS